MLSACHGSCQMRCCAGWPNSTGRMQDFLRNNRGINDGGDLPEEYMSSLYERIQTNEIKMKVNGRHQHLKQQPLISLMSVDLCFWHVHSFAPVVIASLILLIPLGSAWCTIFAARLCRQSQYKLLFTGTS